MLVGLALSTLPAFAQDDEVYLGDVGVAASLPEGWSIPRWGDAYLVAIDQRQTTEVRVTYTPYQVEVSPEAGRVWAQITSDRLVEEGHGDVVIVEVQVAELGGRATALIELTYKYEGTQSSILLQRSFPVEGATLHITATGLKRNAGRANRGLEFWDRHLSVTKPAEELSWGGEVSTDAGFSTSLPNNYRAPVGPELN